ncbi:MAG: 50S ribosomal protein L11 methyltransferase [Desulfobacterota bacterium]|nr:50S ribosomal protein L11 methyltransferase [Thermodesulfobacteriota bacterium]
MDKRNVWIEITVRVAHEYADAVASFLLERGSTGIAQEDLRLQRAGSTACLKAYFLNEKDGAHIAEELQTYIARSAEREGKPLPAADVSVTSIPDEDWSATWKSFFQPLHVTERIVIKPSWHQYRRQEGEIVIELDPGMAFGTGTHPSTRLCLHALDDIALHGEPHLRESLLDVGTGSGILAIAGVLLGFKHVVGIDIDHTAIACAQSNAERNGIGTRLELNTTSIRELNGSFSVIVANILPHTLIYMKAQLVARLAEQGVLILSGILEEKADNVIDAFSTDMRFLRKMHEGNWTCLIFKKASALKS